MKLNRLAVVAAGAALAVGTPLAALTTSTAVVAAPTAHADVVNASIGATFTTPPATWTAADYDGKEFTTNQPDLTSLPKVHAVYMYASDQPDRFQTYGAYFQAEDRRANVLYSKATGMAFRWDDRKAADGRVLQDISVVRARTRLSRVTFATIGTDLAAAGFNDANTKYYVWIDAVSTVNSGICGQSQGQTDAQRTPANVANGTSYSVSWKIASPSAYDKNGGFCNPVSHELTHAIGGVLPNAPHYVAGSHCTDDGNDLMCNISSADPQPYSTTRPRTIDGAAVAGGLGDDDYLDPAADLATVGTVNATGKLGYWAVNLSRFLCPRATPYDATNPTAYDCTVANNPSY